MNWSYYFVSPRDYFDLPKVKIWRDWLFDHAERFEKPPPETRYLIFETGYGPSGLPHIGTFGEVFRTTMVRQAFERGTRESYAQRLIERHKVSQEQAYEVADNRVPLLSVIRRQKENKSARQTAIKVKIGNPFARPSTRRAFGVSSMPK